MKQLTILPLCDLVSGFGRIVLQEPTPEGIWTEYSGGHRVLLPYEKDAAGNDYVDLDPNGDLYH